MSCHKTYVVAQQVMEEQGRMGTWEECRFASKKRAPLPFLIAPLISTNNAYPEHSFG